jgi:uncharacterized delta-60 repeat protein
MHIRKLSVLAGVIAAGVLGGAVTAGASAAAAGGPGSLDPAFGSGGIAILGTGDTVAHDAALLPNGDILVGDDSGVRRLLPNGALDTTFGAAGVASTTFQDGGVGGGWLAVQPDGKILWVGNTGDPSGLTSDFAIARFTPGGTLDAGFGTGGEVATQFFTPPLLGAQQIADAVVVQPDGRILVGGSARQGQNKAAPVQGALLRLTAGGGLDGTFGTGGKVLSTGTVGNVTALGLDAAGDLTVLPSHVGFGPTGQQLATAPAAPVVAASHGGADAFLPSGGYVHATSVGVARHDVDVQLTRSTVDGSTTATTTFDYTATGSQASDSGNAVTLQPDGQAVVGGSRFAGSTLLGLARVGTAGALDPTFGPGGTVTTSVPGAIAFTALLVQPDGKIVAVGAAQDPDTGATELVAARYLG